MKRDEYHHDELMPERWMCWVTGDQCAVSARAGYLARLCRAYGRCLQTPSVRQLNKEERLALAKWMNRRDLGL